jgi:hypothetical protein
MSPRVNSLVSVRGDSNPRANKKLYRLNKKILRLSRRGDWIRMRDLLRNIAISGSIGSGKTSGPMETFQRACWADGHCGLVLCAKPDTAQKAIQLARAFGANYVHIHPESGHHFDPVNFALENSGGKIGTEEALDDLWTMVEIMHRGEVSQSGDNFFVPAGKEALNKSVRLIYLTTGKFNIRQLLQICRETGGMDKAEIERNPDRFLALRMLDHLDKHARAEYRREVADIRSYFMEQAGLSDKTRTSIWITASVRLSPMTDGGSPIYKLFFGGETNITPKDILGKGLLVILDFPYSDFRGAARCIGVGFKQALQKYCLQRKGDESDIPCGIWADESDCWTTQMMDREATSRGRQSRLYHVYTYQAESTLEDGYGGGAVGKSRAKALLSNFIIRVMCAQIDPETRLEGGQKTIGNSLQWTRQISQSETSGSPQMEGTGWSRSESYSQSWMPAFPESFLLGLETGQHGFIEAYVINAGERFRWNKQRYLLVRWYQNHAGWRFDSLHEQYPTARPWADHPGWFDLWRWARKGEWKTAFYRFMNFWYDGMFRPGKTGGNEASHG